MAGRVEHDISDIRALLKTLVTIKAYDAGLITRKEAYERTGIISEIADRGTANESEKVKFMHG